MNTAVHVDLAETALRQVDVPEGRAGLTNPQLIALAQAHATLALVAEQRMANEIAVLALPGSALDIDDMKRAQTDSAKERANRRNVLRRRVAEGMGL